MLSNRLAFAALAIACIGAAAGGGYLATRQNTVPTPASAQSQPAAMAPSPAPVTTASPATVAASDAPVPPSKAVQETEGVVGQAPRKLVPPAKANPVRPAEPTRASARASSAPIAHGDPAPLNASNSSMPVPTSQPPVVESAPSPHPEERAAQEPTRPVEPPQRTFAEYVVSAESVIGLQTENRVSSETARVEDRIEARVTRDVKVGDHVAIPAGSRAIGSVMQVERGGKFKERARLGIRFHTLVLADGTRIPISTETIFRDGEAPSTAPRVGGGAVAGTILGAILGGGKGAAIGAAAGAGAGAATLAAGDRNAATLPAGTAMTVRILQPITVTSERN